MSNYEARSAVDLDLNVLRTAEEAGVSADLEAGRVYGWRMEEFRFRSCSRIPNNESQLVVGCVEGRDLASVVGVDATAVAGEWVRRGPRFAVVRHFSVPSVTLSAAR